MIQRLIWIGGFIGAYIILYMMLKKSFDARDRKKK